MLETRTRDEAKLRKKYDEIPVREKKKRKEQKAKLPARPRGRPRRCFDMETAKEIVRAEGIGSVLVRWFGPRTTYSFFKTYNRQCNLQQSIFQSYAFSNSIDHF